MKRPALYAIIGVSALVFIGLVAALLAPQPDAPGAAKDAGGDGLKLTAETEKASASSRDDAAVRAELKHVQRRFQDAVRKRNMEAVLALMTPDFTMKPLNGAEINRQAAEAAMRQTWPDIVSISDWTLEIVDLKVEGNKATGTVRERLKAVLKDADGNRYEESRASRSHNVWVRTASGWKYRRMAELQDESAPGKVESAQDLNETFAGLEFTPASEWRQKTAANRAAARAASQQKQDRSQAAPVVKPVTEAEARTMLRDMYAAFRADVRRKDAKAALAKLTDNYTVEYPDHNEGRGAVERGMAGEFKATLEIPEWNQTVRAVTVDGNTVTAVVEDRKTSLFRDPNGQTRTSRVEATMRDTWIKTPKGWKNRRTEIQKLRAYLDGKLVHKVN